jgi:hypothetical protein
VKIQVGAHIDVGTIYLVPREAADTASKGYGAVVGIK